MKTNAVVQSQAVSPCGTSESWQNGSFTNDRHGITAKNSIRAYDQTTEKQSASLKDRVSRWGLLFLHRLGRCSDGLHSIQDEDVYQPDRRS